MISVGSSAGGEALYLREIHTRATPTEQPVSTDPLPHDAPSHTSLGRLLRLLGDPRSNESHMEAAIAHVDASTKRVVSDGTGASATPKAVFSLADHRHISNLETVLRTADRAIQQQDAVSTSSVDNTAASRNLVRALASALVTQSVEECSSTKANLCVWTAQSKKRLRLLQWLLNRSSQATAIVLEEVFRSQLSSCEPQAKSSQMTACLVVFELAQRVRRHHEESITEGWSVLIDPLTSVVHKSTVQTPAGVKASKLGVVALDALLAVLCVTATEVSTATKGIDATVLNGMKVAVETLIQWNARSSKRQWLLVAARQLLGVISSCWLSESRETAELIVWHWNASAMWLCSRSDVVIAAKKKLTAFTTRTILELYDGLARSKDSGLLQPKSSHITAVMLRRLCILRGLHSSTPDELRNCVFTTFKVTGKLLVSLATACTSPTSRDLAVEILRLFLLRKTSQGFDRPEPLLLLPTGDIKAFISLMVKLNVKGGRVESDIVASFIAELCLTSGISIMAELQANSEVAVIQFWLSILNQALSQYPVTFAQDQALCRQWLRDATLAVLQLIHAPEKEVRQAALRMLSKLDLTAAIQAVGTTLLYEVDPRTSGSLVTLLFLYADCTDDPRAAELANVLMEAIYRGPADRGSSVNQPSDISSGSIVEDQSDEQRQALVMALSIQGWCAQATHSSRNAVLSLLIRKAFGSPRDPWPLSWLRELSLLGWFEPGLADILPLITGHMQTLARLTEELLEDNSSHASKTVEQLLFARLAPNLVLRVIPRSAFHELYNQRPVTLLSESRNGRETMEAWKSGEHCLQDLAQLLWSQALDTLEFKDVKMLAIELLTKLPAHEILPHALTQLIAFLREQGSPPQVLRSLVGDESIKQLPGFGGGFVTAKLMVYYLNRLFTDDASSGGTRRAREQTWSVLFTVLSLPCDPEESFSAQRSPLVDLQMGAIESLALLVSKSLKQARSSVAANRPSVEDLVVQLIVSEPASDNVLEHEDLLSRWRATVHCVDENQDHFSRTQLQICCCNVLLSSLSKLDDSTLPAFQELVLRSGLLSTGSLQTLQRPVLAGRLQVVFSYMFRAGSTLEPTDRVSAEIVAKSLSSVVEILHSSAALPDQVYMSTLKLLGALIGKVSWLWPSLSTSESGELAIGLKNLRDTEHAVSPPVRQLAQSLLQATLPA